MPDTQEQLLTLVTSLLGTDYIRGVKTSTPESVNIELTKFISLVGALSMFSSPKNLFHNGAMNVAQRGTSLTGITTTGYSLDRWTHRITTLGTWTISQQADAPTGSGFRNSVKLLVTTADAAPSAGDFFIFTQKIEGQFLQHLRKGTSSTKKCSLSFWVKSNLTGTYIAELEDVDNTRSISTSFVVSVADTWEFKQITFSGDTSGVLDNDINESLRCNIWIGAGSNYASGTLQTSWGSTVSANRAVGQANLAATINNYIQFTGMQLEPNDSVSGFEFIPFDIEKFRCGRYYKKTFPYSVTPAQNTGQEGAFAFQVERAGAVTHQRQWLFAYSMRAEPTITTYNPSAANAQPRDITGSLDFSGIATASPTNENNYTFNSTGNAGTVAGNVVNVHITADAEL